MKRLLPLVILLISASVFAQSPNAFNYQAVVRDASGNIIANQSVGLRMAILQGSQNGTIVYQESFTPTTSDFGLANVAIGTGNVLNGSFANINWGNGPYYIQVAADPTGGTAYSLLGTSQLLSVPYALYAKNVPVNVSELTNDAGYITSANDADSNPTNEIQTLTLSGSTLSISSGNSVTLPSSGGGNTLDAAYDQGGAGAGRIITADAGEVAIYTATANGIGLRVSNTNTGAGIIAQNTNSANTFSPIQAETNSTSASVAAVIGNTTGAAYAVAGQVQSTATAQSAVYGSNLRTNGGHGVHGIGFNGVVGETNYSQGNAVFGENYETLGSLGNGIGVAGTGYYGVVGEDRYLGAQAGAYGVFSNGNLTATGTKAFTIDHPTDPENKFLRHFSSESNEVLNIYRGNATFDANGEAVVEMPEYYDLINKNPSYQLTPVGGYMQLFIKEKLENGRFVIGGGTPGAEASWTVYAERNDPYLQQYPFHRNVEIEKREGQKGKYLMPQLYNEGADKKMINSPTERGSVQTELNLNK